ncbi:MAG TPA: DUF6659 family protein [Nitrososphaera sp.]|jgi:hypothetical protein
MVAIVKSDRLGIDYEFLHQFCLYVLATAKSVRWAGVVNKNGIIIAQHTREGMKLLLTEEENEEYAASAIARQKTRGRYDSKIGKMRYAFGRYEKLHRATIPINENHYLLVTIDVEERNFDALIIDRMIPLIEKHRSRFVTMNDSI